MNNFGGQNQGYGQQNFSGNLQHKQGYNWGYQGGNQGHEAYRPPQARNQGQGFNSGNKGGSWVNPQPLQPQQHQQAMAPDVQSQILTQLQALSQQNQLLTLQIQEINAHGKMVDNQLAQLANSPPPPLFPGNAQPNPAAQSSNAQHSAKAIHLRSGTAYEGPSMPQEDAPEGVTVKLLKKKLL
ncbi:unnamed protein product [Amaranthus hypochondriacus]